MFSSGPGSGLCIAAGNSTIAKSSIFFDIFDTSIHLLRQASAGIPLISAGCKGLKGESRNQNNGRKTEYRSHCIHPAISGLSPASTKYRYREPYNGFLYFLYFCVRGCVREMSSAILSGRAGPSSSRGRIFRLLPLRCLRIFFPLCIRGYRE